MGQGYGGQVSWLPWLAIVLAVASMGVNAWRWWTIRKAFRAADAALRKLETPSRVDQLHAELHAREPAKVIVGPWMVPARCPDCGLEFERPRIVTDERCEPCKAKAWHEQELADREQWEKSPGVVKMPDGKEVVMSDALIIRKDWGK